jgi:MSHA biogenesis protein MshJ
MVPPEKMQSFLEGLLTRNRGLELLDLKTLPVTQIGAPAAAKPAAAGAAAATEPALAAAEGIYQHGVEIRLAGSYNDLLNYLTELERMPQRVMWNSVSLTVDKYPRNIMTLRIYTLSLDSKWLTV